MPAWLAACPAAAQVQQDSGSPYSAHALGDLIGPGQVVQAGMGGLGVTTADPFSVARANPATYPWLAHATFEMGVAARWMRMRIGDDASTGRNLRLQGFSVGVPFGRGKWGLALGLQPYSTTAYRIEDRLGIAEGEVRHLYMGEGGISRSYLGLGRVLWQRRDSTGRLARLTIGANFEFLFGTLTASRKAYYPLGTGHYNSSIESSLALRAPTATVGILHSADLIGPERARQAMARRKERILAKDRRLEMDWLNAGRDPAGRRHLRVPKGRGEALRWRAGLGIDLPTTFAAQHTLLATTFTMAGTVEATRDTAARIDGAFGSIALPMGVTGGVALHNSRWMVALEAHQRDWGGLRADVEGYAVRTELRRAQALVLGGSYRPAGDQGGPFLRRAIYRAGLRWAEQPLSLRGTGIQEIGMSFGLSLPIAGATTRSRINLSVEHGQRGTTANGLLSERYTALWIGATITPDIREQWFKKRRIE